jgi:predicted metal-dependent enzyme (double-stranded beta helix superfamily)
MFNTEQFIDDCKSALAESEPQKVLRSIVERAVSDPNSIIKELGEPQEAGLNTVYQSEGLTIMNLVWGPEMELHPHDHCMTAVIGIYGGKEDNTFYRRNDSGLKQHGIKTIEAGQVAPLGRDIIHSVKNPLLKLTAALHVYTGDFFTQPRSEWDFETLTEKPLDIENTRAAFASSNERLRELRESGVM